MFDIMLKYTGIIILYVHNRGDPIKREKCILKDVKLIYIHICTYMYYAMMKSVLAQIEWFIDEMDDISRISLGNIIGSSTKLYLLIVRQGIIYSNIQQRVCLSLIILFLSLSLFPIFFSKVIKMDKLVECYSKD